MQTFQDLFETIFGVYTPFTYTDLTTGATVYATDWGYVARIAIFAIALYSTFRIIGLLFGGGKR